jgi:hypothetical protein
MWIYACIDRRKCAKAEAGAERLASHPPDDSTETFFPALSARGRTGEHLYLQTDMGMVNILTSIKGVGDFQRLNAAAEEIEVDGQKIRVIALNDLITAREAMGRERDLLTAKELRAIAAKRQAEKK